METQTNSFKNNLDNFSDKANAAVDDAVNAVKDATNTVTGKASALKEKTQEIGRTAMDKLDQNRVAAASTLRGTANSLHETADKLPNVPEMTHSAARKVESMADYLETKDTRQFLGDIGAVVKRNPMPSLVVAALAGFLIGRSLRTSE